MQSSDKFVVRMPAGLRDRIRLEAGINRRSMNGEIVYRLEKALAASETETAPGGEIAAKTPDAVET